MIPFQKKWIYTPEMKGSYSIKYVLPALVSNLSYDKLAIKDGGTASNTFLSMVNNKFIGNEEEERENLLEYCKMDSYAMVRILEKLKNLKWLKYCPHALDNEKINRLKNFKNPSRRGVSFKFILDQALLT